MELSFRRHFLFPFTAHFLYYGTLCALAPFPVHPRSLLSLPSTPSGLTFHRFALSSVTFIVYGVDDEVADDEVYSDAPRSSGPAGRPSQSECLISYFWFSYFVAPFSVPPSSFLDLLPKRRLSSYPPVVSRPFRAPTFLTIELQLQRAISRVSSKAYV